jgi:hypothetical protein
VNTPFFLFIFLVVVCSVYSKAGKKERGCTLGSYLFGRKSHETGQYLSSSICARYANELESEQVHIKDVEEAILMLASLQITLHKMSASLGYGPTGLLDIFTVVFVLVTLPLCLSIVLPKEPSSILSGSKAA